MYCLFLSSKKRKRCSNIKDSNINGINPSLVNGSTRDGVVVAVLVKKNKFICNFKLIFGERISFGLNYMASIFDILSNLEFFYKPN